MTMRSRLSVWAMGLGLALALPGSVMAAAGDRTRPVNIESDGGGVYNQRTGRTELSGRVVLTQGTLQMRSRRMEAQQRDDGSTFALAQGDPTEPVRFEQARDLPGERVTGQAERIEYDSRAETVRFVGGATVRRNSKRSGFAGSCSCWGQAPSRSRPSQRSLKRVCRSLSRHL